MKGNLLGDSQLQWEMTHLSPYTILPLLSEICLQLEFEQSRSLLGCVMVDTSKGRHVSLT